MTHKRCANNSETIQEFERRVHRIQETIDFAREKTKEETAKEI